MGSGRGNSSPRRSEAGRADALRVLREPLLAPIVVRLRALEQAIKDRHVAEYASLNIGGAIRARR